MGGGVALAQAPDANWLVGKWRGVFEGNRQRSGPQIVIRSDGTFEGEAPSSLVGLIRYQKGKWRTAGDTVILEYFVSSTLGSSEVTWTLKRNGEDLEGSGIRHSDSFQGSVKLKKIE